VLVSASLCLHCPYLASTRWENHDIFWGLFDIFFLKMSFFSKWQNNILTHFEKNTDFFSKMYKKFRFFLINVSWFFQFRETLWTTLSGATALFLITRNLEVWSWSTIWILPTLTHIQADLYKKANNDTQNCNFLKDDRWDLKWLHRNDWNSHVQF